MFTHKPYRPHYHEDIVKLEAEVNRLSKENRELRDKAPVKNIKAVISKPGSDRDVNKALLAFLLVIVLYFLGMAAALQSVSK